MDDENGDQTDPQLPPAPAPSEPAAEVTANEPAPNGETTNGETVVDLGGAPLANANHLSHGLNSDPAIGHQRFILGKLPPSLARVERAANAFRKTLEDAVELAHGRIGVEAAANIQTAASWERHALLASRWLREHCNTLEPAEKLAFSREVPRARQERAKAIAALKLGKAGKTLIATLYPKLHADDAV